MFQVPGSKFKVLGCAVIALSCILNACGNEKEKPVQNTPTIAPPADDSLPFIIELLPGYKVKKQQGADFVVYYFMAEDTSQSDNEGGIYFGAFPDTSAPRAQEYTRRDFRDVFMGDSANWREYTTATYVQREVYIELGPQEKIHSWCYSNDSLKLEQLFGMIKSIK